jgi:tRNA threonylcarbamoyladenosine modification (KEOPS) complex  Pcc1 subunit
VRTEFKSALKRLRVGLRERVAKSLVAVLVAPLFCIVPSVMAPSFTPQAHAASCANGGSCSIGDTGPGGGIVFYVASTYLTEGSALCSVGCKYLEAAPSSGSNGWSDLNTSLWGGSNTSVSGTGTTIGTGYANTAAIVAGSSTAGKAATAATAYRGPNDKTDWFLPSRDELTQMWIQRAAIGIPTGGNWYWSSSQSVSCCAYVQKFDGNGTTNDFNKTDSAYVRPIRAFYPVPGSISITKTAADPYGGYSGNDFINFNFPAGHGLNDKRSFTIETWAYLDNANGNTSGIVSLTAGDQIAPRNQYWTSRRSGFLVNPASPGNWFAEANGDANCNPTALLNTIPTLAWVHIAYQRSLVSGTATDSIYVGGKFSGSCVVNTTNVANDTVRIGTTSGNSGTSNTSFFGPTRIIDGEAIYSADFTPSTSFGAYAANSSGTGTTILNIAPTTAAALTFVETPPYTPTLTYGATYTFNGSTLTTSPTYGMSVKSPPIYTGRDLTINPSSFSSSYSLGSTGPTISATASGGTGTKSYSTTTSSVCTIASSGLVTLVSVGTCSIAAQIANDGTYAAATATSISFSVTKAVPTLTLALPQNATTAIYGTAISITATVSTPGSVTFKSGGTAITGCSSTASSTSGTYSATCSWTPSALGTSALTADFVPTSSNYDSLSGAASLSINVTGLTVATLSGLALSSGTLSPTFDSATTSYTSSVANSVASGYTVTPTKSDSNASTAQYIGSTGTTVFSGALAVGANVIRTVVTAQDGATTKTYTVTVTRAASTDATLSALALSSGTLSPTFASGTTSYTASVANSVTSITVTPTRTQANATITVNGTTVTSGTASGSISLNVGSNTISVVVTAQDGTTTGTYTVIVTRLSNDATLSALVLSSGTLNPSFASGTTSYTASVANSVTSITVTPTRAQANATITVNGTSVTSGTASGSISLNVGSNTLSVIVTAQDGTTTGTYTVTVTRAASTDATLSSLALSSGTLSPSFASTTESYTASVPNSVTSINVTPTRTQANATITVNGTSVTSGSASGSISLNVGSNTITVVVTAQDGTTTKSYTVTVTRLSNDATLSALALSSGTISPTFASGTTSYTASVANSVTSITVTPTRTQANATITVNGTSVTSGTASGSIPLSNGSNTVTVVVTAQDGSTTKSYTVTVTRLSNTATISTFSFNSLSPVVTGSVDNSLRTVQLSVPTGTNLTALVATFTLSSGATAAVASTPQVSGQTANNFTSAVTYVLTSQDSSTVQNYTVTVVVASNPSAPQNLTATGGQGSASLSWSAPASDGGRPVTGYVVESSLDSTNWINVEQLTRARPH